MAEISPRRVVGLVRSVVEQILTPDEPFFRRRLREHFGADPATLTLVGEKFQSADHPNVHLAIEAFVSAPSRRHELLGISSEHATFMGVSLGQLVAPTARYQAPISSTGGVC